MKENPAKRSYYKLYCKIKAAENTPVVLYVAADKQYTVRRMLEKERTRDKDYRNRSTHLLRFSNPTTVSITVMWHRLSGADLAQQASAGTLFLNVAEETSSANNSGGAQ